MKNITNIILGVCTIALLVFLVKVWFINSTIEEPVQVYNEEYDIIDSLDNGNEDIQDD